MLEIIIGTNNLVYNYEYSGNQIVEKINNKLIRTFSIENGNLTKIEKWNYNDSIKLLEKLKLFFQILIILRICLKINFS